MDKMARKTRKREDRLTKELIELKRAYSHVSFDPEGSFPSDAPGRIPVRAEKVGQATVYYLDESDTTPKKGDDITYKLDDSPPWYMCFILGLQHYLTMVGGTVTYPYILARHLGIPDTDPARGYLVTTAFFVSGICTLIQTTIGVRLPIVQGSSMAFLVPIIAIMGLPQLNMEREDIGNETQAIDNITNEAWMDRMREVQGAIIGASLFEVLIGFTGIMGFLMNWITPLAIVPTVALVGLSLFAEAANAASGHWGVAGGTILLLIIFSQYLKDVEVPFPKYLPTNGWNFQKFPFFKLFPVLLTILISWFMCWVLTISNVFSEGSPARTDVRQSVLSDSPWIRLPYPGQWGAPTFSTAAIFAVLGGVLASAIESVGDYYACARLAGAPPPPKHAINRGILVEGIGCIISGLFGTGGGVTSYSENIGAIGITKVASRRVLQFGSILMILFGMIGKFGALFVTIPDPIIGGVFCIMFAVITSVGLSTLHYVDLHSSRNLFILGFSMFMGLCVPKWMQANPGVIHTGSDTFDQILTVLLSTSMLVGGLLGFFLDNTIPGTDEERGILKWKKHDLENPNFTGNTTIKTYDIPCMAKIFEENKVFHYLPASPSYDEEIVKLNFIKRGKGQKSEESSLPMSSTL